MLRALGAPISGPADIATAAHTRQVTAWQQPLAPVTLAWRGQNSKVELRLPADVADGEGSVSLYLEGCLTAPRHWRLADLKQTGGVSLDGGPPAEDGGPPEEEAVFTMPLHSRTFVKNANALCEYLELTTPGVGAR